jgi:hypothetical protein
MHRLRQLFRSLSARRAPARRAPTSRPGLEQLEDRLIPTATAVGSTFDVSGVLGGGQDTRSSRSVAKVLSGPYAGNFGVVWKDSNGLTFRLFKPDGTAAAAAVHVPGTAAAAASVPGTGGEDDDEATIAASNNGTFVVAWAHSYSSTDIDVYAQRFTAGGQAKGGTVYVATSGQSEVTPSVGMDATGKFVVAYAYDNGLDSDVYARRFDAAGNYLGTIAVATTGKGEFEPSVAMNANGNFVVAYTYAYNYNDYDVYARRYSATGVAQGPTIYVATSGQFEEQPSVGMDANGNFVVAYTYDNGADLDVYANRYSASGSLQQTISVATSGKSELQPSVAMNGNGGFGIAYTYVYSYSDYDVYVQCYSSSGASKGPAVVAGMTDGNNEFNQSVALDNNNRLVAVWTNSGQKAGGAGVFAQRFTIS